MYYGSVRPLFETEKCHNISYDATSSTDIVYNKCNIIVLTVKLKHLTSNILESD